MKFRSPTLALTDFKSRYLEGRIEVYGRLSQVDISRVQLRILKFLDRGEDMGVVVELGI
jgi:hypothetical protein